MKGLVEVALRLITPEGSTLEATQQKLSVAKEGLKYDPDASDYFDFLPAYVGAAVPRTSFQFSGSCFQDIKVTGHEMHSSACDYANVTIDLQNPVSTFCFEGLIVATDTQYFFHEYFTR